MLLENLPLVAIDTETSGINPFSHQILAVAFVPLLESLPTKTVYIRHEKISWTPFARANFERFEHEWENQALHPQIACVEIEQYLAGSFANERATPIGHNVGFDMAFLRQLAFLAGKDEIGGLSHRAVDTHTLLFALALEGIVPPSALSSDGAFRHFGISVPVEARHTAYGDAMATRTLFRKITDLLPEQSQAPKNIERLKMNRPA
jgi:DNA polymerase III subunit epsilon